jgi:localization factor PodJL
MTSGAWSTRPFRPETLEAAREAARRSGLSLAEWLNSAILDTAADAGVRAGRRGFDADDLGGPPDDALATMGGRLDQLAWRIDQLSRRDGEPGAWRPHTSASQSAPEMRSALHAIEARLASMAREVVPQGQAASQRLVEVIRDLNARIDRLATIAPERADVPAHDPPAEPAPREPTEDRAKREDRGASLSSALAEISARQRELDAQIGVQDFSRLERQLRHITEQIETLRHPGDAGEAAAARDADRAALERVETQILELARKLDRSDARLEALDTIERRIVELAHKLETSDARLDGVEALERSLADLMFQLKEIRAAAVEEAQHAAKTVAGEMLAEADATGNEIDALKQDLTELRVSRAEIDHRTEDALEMLQRTLERLVDRLATIESGIRTAARNSPEPQEARGPSTSRTGSPIPSVNPPAPKLAPEQRPFDPDLPADHPLEPGSGVPRGRGPASAAPRSAASEPAPANPAAPEPAAKANFIAAARRAAQAAAAESAEPTEPAEERSQGGGGIAAAMGRRRSLMIAAGVLLFGAGGLHVAINGAVSPVPGIEDLVRIAGKISAAEGKPTGKAKQAPASGEARTARVPEPIVPESRSSSARRPSSAAGEEFLLSPVPSGSLTPTASSQARESIAPATAWPPPPPPPARTSEITGSFPVAQANPATLASQRPASEPAADAAEKLPPGIGSSALRAAAGAGNPAAEYEIGIRYSEGRSVAQSFEEAALWLSRAADHGLAPAQYRLGSLYEKGQGVKKDLGEARRLYLAAAQQGNGKAMHNLAVLYAVGLDGGPDYKTASQWFQKAADHGIADSQYNLGILYARGVGVEQNLAEAFKWFALAAQQGDKDAAKKRDEVAARLDPQALIAARLAAQTWTADPQPDNAIKVEAPGGDWDRALPATPASKSKAGRRTGTSGSA